MKTENLSIQNPLVLCNNGEPSDQDIETKILNNLEEVDPERREHMLLMYYDLGQRFSKIAIKCYVKLLKDEKEHDQALFMKSLEMLTKEKIKKSRFTTEEVKRITGIGSDGTITNYFKQGIIKAEKDARGRWFVQRKDLADYIGNDDFD